METFASIRKRIAEADPLVVDIVTAVALALAACLQIWLVSHARPAGLPVPPNLQNPVFRPDREQAPVWIAYVIALASFLPLALRRKIPWLALLLTGGAALAYQLIRDMPPAFVSLGPMLALYSFAVYSKRRRSGLIGLLAAGVVIAVPVFALSSSVRWVAETVGYFVLLAAAALFGDAERNRREYVAEVERRAADAERTREEEALRRVDEERIRIAREVHDIVAHSLSIVTVQASAAQALLDQGNTGGARDSIQNVRTTGKEALAELRSMLDVLRTGEGDAPLEPAVHVADVARLVEPLRDAGLNVTLQLTGSVDTVPAYAATSAYRIVQEALTNVVRHAGAHDVSVHVGAGARELVVEIADDGIGADPAAAAKGHGLQGMRERVEALGGVFNAGTSPAGGFRVFASIPLPRSS